MPDEENLKSNLDIFFKINKNRSFASRDNNVDYDMYIGNIDVMAISALGAELMPLSVVCRQSSIFIDDYCCGYNVDWGLSKISTPRLTYFHITGSRFVKEKSYLNHRENNNKKK
jgi:hypothetical protein